MTYSTFDKKTLGQLRKELNAVLEKFGADSNIELSVGNMKFSSTEVEIKVSAKIAGAKTSGDAILEARVESMGLRMTNARGDTLMDYKPRNWKMPFIYRNGQDGKSYKCDATQAKRLFG